MRFSKNFTLNELLRSEIAGISGYDEQFHPDSKIIETLAELSTDILQPARDFMKAPILVTSCYRCPALNRAVGGAKHSDHLYGRAADIRCPHPLQTRDLFFYIKDNLDFKQLIWYFDKQSNPTFVHVSRQEGKNRKEVLICYLKNGKRRYRRWEDDHVPEV